MRRPAARLLELGSWGCCERHATSRSVPASLSGIHATDHATEQLRSSGSTDSAHMVSVLIAAVGCLSNVEEQRKRFAAFIVACNVV